MSDFSTSTPTKKTLLPNTDNSGVSIEMSEATESDKMLSSSADSGMAEEKKVTVEIFDGLSEIGSDSSSEVQNANTCCPCFMKIQVTVHRFMTSHSALIKNIILGLVIVGYFVYFGIALGFSATWSCEEHHDVIPLVILTCIALSLYIISFVWAKFGDSVHKKVLIPCHKSINNNWNVLKWVFCLIPLGGVITIVILTVWNTPSNLISVAGFTFFIIILFLCSSAPSKVKWRPVIGGFVLQFFFATLILKWDLGYRFFSFLGDEARKFLAYTDVGSRFVFGNKFSDHIFAMQVLPVVVFFSCVITVLYHLGIMECVISKIAFVMKLTLGTTAAESLCAAGNIFVGQTEAPILIRPFLGLMTKSELHAVMVGGFATIAGGVLVAYIKFGIPPEHLLCASVMNAPCSLAVSKLLCPETEKSKITNTNALVDNKQKYRNLLEAAAAGASQSITLVANIAANLIAFLALLAFVNATIAWFGSFICIPNLSFEKICHYLLMPVVYLMGVRWEDAGVVAELVALKTFLNEFVAYEKLSGFINNRITCATEGHILSPRSEVIATYALCGFSNISSIGIMLGGLGPMAPHRISDMASIVVSALFGGVTACLITASIAGLLVAEIPVETCATALDLLAQNATTVLVNVTSATIVSV